MCCCKDINCSKNIRCKRYFLPLICVPLAAIHPDVLNFYYFPLLVAFSAFILFWNFPKIVYYTASRPLYYEDLFIDEKKLPNYDVNPNLKNKFKCILEWILITTNAILVGGLSDWWLYRTQNKGNIIEIIGVTGGIIKVFQTINNTISRIMLNILKHEIKNENKKLQKLQEEKIKKIINFKLISNEGKKNRERFDTI